MCRNQRNSTLVGAVGAPDECSMHAVVALENDPVAGPEELRVLRPQAVGQWRQGDILDPGCAGKGSIGLPQSAVTPDEERKAVHNRDAALIAAVELSRAEHLQSV